jgi:hypothetical protein
MLWKLARDSLTILMKTKRKPWETNWNLNRIVVKLESCWKRNSIESLKKTEGNLFCKIIEILYECFEIWQAIPSQFIRKPNENHRKLIEILTRSSFSWNPAGGEIQSKVLRKLKEIALANWLKFCKNVLKVGRRFPHKS